MGYMGFVRGLRRTYDQFLPAALFNGALVSDSQGIYTNLPDAADTTIRGTFQKPADAVAVGSVTLFVVQTGLTSGNLFAGISAISNDDGDSVGSQPPTLRAIAMVDQSGSGVDRFRRVSITLDGTGIVIGEETYSITLRRDATDPNDTFTADLFFYGVIVRWTLQP